MTNAKKPQPDAAKAPKKPLTPSGFKRLSAEYHQLFEVDRPKMVENMVTAAAEGDRSENAEYIYSRKRIREIDKKLRQLTHLLKDVTVVDPRNIRSDRVEFGATVTIEDEHGVRAEWTIVGEGEADVAERTISYKSPLARALTGRKVGDFLLFRKPSGEVELEIIALNFGGHP